MVLFIYQARHEGGMDAGKEQRMKKRWKGRREVMTKGNERGNGRINFVQCCAL